MREFDQSVKRTFNEKTNETLTVDLFGVEDDRDNGIRDNTIELPKYLYQYRTAKLELTLEQVGSKRNI